MLSERPYLRGNSSPGNSATVTWLLAILVGCYLIQVALPVGNTTPPTAAVEALGLSADDFAPTDSWRLATFWLLHSPTNLLHLLVVASGVAFAGRSLLHHISPARLIMLFVGANSVGALAWLAMRQGTGEILVGSSAGAFGLLALFASIYPAREFRILLLFAFPVTLRPKQLLALLLSVDLATVLIVDVLGRELPFAYAAPSHLAGALVGWCYYHFWLERRSTAGEAPTALGSPEAVLVRTEPTLAAIGRSPLPGPTPTEDLRARVDTILDKISSQGIASLTPSERRLLDEARTRWGQPR